MHYDWLAKVPWHSCQGATPSTDRSGGVYNTSTLQAVQVRHGNGRPPQLGLDCPSLYALS